MRVDKLINKYRSAGVHGTAELLVRPYVARSIIRDCTSEWIVVIGVEAFLVESSRVTPLPEYIADYSAMIDNGCHADCVRICNESADQFVASLPDDAQLHVALVLQDGA